MGDVKEFSMKLASREWARLTYSGVVRSFAKTVTEPVTNSDTSYKRKYSLQDASGIIEKAIAFEKGSKFDLSAIKKDLAGKAPERIIEIHLYTAQGHGVASRTCDVVDFAEGLTQEELVSVFSELAADKSDQSKGKPGRSLFGRGVSDVLLGHKNGTFYSYKDQTLSKAEFLFDHKKDSGPRVRVTSAKNPLVGAVKELHLRRQENGSCARFALHEDCRIPDEGTLIPILSQFYMLRLINTDPNVKIRVFRYRSGGKVVEDALRYDFPIGDVIGKFSFSIPNPVPGGSLKAVKVDGIVCRAESKVGLPGKDAGDQRANGLLIVDDKDAVLDLTFLPQFEGAPYLANVFGIVRLGNGREVFSWYLNSGKDSPLTVTRDGFDTKHEFTRLLFKELTKILEPVYKKEEDRFNKSHATDISAEARERVNQALKELNRFLKQIGGGEGEEPLPPSPPTPSKPLQFMPESTKLVVGKERTVRLYLAKSQVKRNGSIIYDSNNPKIEITPLSHLVEDGNRIEEYFVYSLSIKCEGLHEAGIITALAEVANGVLEARLEITDVISGLVVNPPEDMEFRPKDSRGQPSRENNVALFINPSVIPLNRKIKLSLEKTHGTIGLVDKDDLVESISVIFEKDHLIPSHNVGRILIPWRGTGWGQSARIVADTKKPDGSIVHSEGRIIIEQPEDSGGMIKRVEYTPLDNQKCSDLVDGIIYINSNHSLNKMVFGSMEEYKQKLDKDRTAQYKFSEVIVEQSVFRLAEDSYTKNKLTIRPDAPVTSIREFVDKKTHELAPKIMRVLMTR